MILLRELVLHIITHPRIEKGWILMKHLKARTIWAVLLTAVLVVSVTGSALASHGDVSLPGSNFEIDIDANIKVDHTTPSIDWANVNEIRKADSPSGANDESFGQGSKEDTAIPSVVNGSIPPNKSDLKFFGIYQEGGTTNGFLHLFWSRVQDPSGTTNMDFEFNQSNTLSSNGVTPVRTVGDLLIIYDLSQGGTHPTLSIREWTGSAWGPATDLTASGKATGSINTSPIPAAESDGLGGQSARTFGEASIALSGIFGDPTVCQSFGAAYLKSRSSDSFTAALKDFIPPVTINVSNCGSVKIVKTDDAANPLAGATFELYKDNAPVGGSRGVEDTATGQTCTTVAGECTITNVLQGEYWVVETVTPAGYDTAADQHATVAPDVTVTLTFVDPRQLGAIQVTKTAKHAGAGSADLAATFTVKQNGSTVGTITTDGTTGLGCLGDLPLGSYTVEETTGPAGYAKDPDVETVNVSAKGTCASGYVNVSFENIPLSNITVSFESQVAGGTAAKISCTGLTSDPADGTPNAFDDTSETFKNLQPGTYTCTVVVDP
jgi:hypothetical protein